MKNPPARQNLSPGKTHPQITWHLACLLSVLIVALIGLGFYGLVSHMSTARATEQLAAISNHDSGSTIDEVIDTLQTDMPDIEIIFVFDKDGNKLIEYTCDSAYGVSLPRETIPLLRQFRDLTHAHNHPLHDGGHSDNDLSMPDRTGLDDAIKTLAVITPNYVYYVDRGTQNWPTIYSLVQYSAVLSDQYGPLLETDLMDAIVVDNEIYPYFTDKGLSRFVEHFGHHLRIVARALG